MVQWQGASLLLLTLCLPHVCVSPMDSRVINWNFDDGLFFASKRIANRGKKTHTNAFLSLYMAFICGMLEIFSKQMTLTCNCCPIPWSMKKVFGCAISLNSIRIHFYALVILNGTVYRVDFKMHILIWINMLWWKNLPINPGRWWSNTNQFFRALVISSIHNYMNSFEITSRSGILIFNNKTDM